MSQTSVCLIDGTVFTADTDQELADAYNADYSVEHPSAVPPDVVVSPPVPITPGGPPL